MKKLLLIFFLSLSIFQISFAGKGSGIILIKNKIDFEVLDYKKIIIGNKIFILTTNTLSSSYCRGGKLISIKGNKEAIIYSSKNQCILSLDKISKGIL